MVRRIAWCSALLVVPSLLLLLGMATAPAQAQQPNPDDPFVGAPVRWFLSNDGSGLYRTGDPTLGLATTDEDGMWSMEFDWGQLNQIQGEPVMGIHITPLTRTVGSTVRVVAGLWSLDSIKYSMQPLVAFQFLDVGFYEDQNLSGLLEDNGVITEQIGPFDEANLRGDAICNAPGCPHTFNPGPGGAPIPLGVTMFLPEVDLTPAPICMEAGAVLFTLRQGLGAGAGAPIHVCATRLGGQVWNCLADGNCHTFE